MFQKLLPPWYSHLVVFIFQMGFQSVSQHVAKDNNKEQHRNITTHLCKGCFSVVTGDVLISSQTSHLMVW